MELKKSPEADLENKKSVFMQIGLVVVLALVLIAFEWSTTDVSASKFDMIEDVAAEEEIVPITRQEQVTPPPPPPPPLVADVLNIVDNDVEILEELDIKDTEVDENTEVKFEVALEEEEEETAVFFIVEDMPQFPGGDLALRKYIAQAVKYPVIAQENGIQGRVYVQFVVGTDGSVGQVKVARGVDPNLDKEAIRVVQSMPKWTPGKQRGKAVKVSYTVPINFVLQ